MEELSKVLAYAHHGQLPLLMLGKGSNILFDDAGFNGVVVLCKIAHYAREGLEIAVGAGYSFSLLGSRTARENLGGLEFAAGIPASVGGAIAMNAGIGEESCQDSLVEVTYVTAEGKIQVFKKEELEFGYRTSCFQRWKGAVAGARFRLIPSEGAQGRVQALLERRIKSQPYKAKSAGCVFKNPSTSPLSAGALIDRCGLKGVRRGGAEVSPLHANFIVNLGDATSKDVLALAEHIRCVVKEKTGIELEKELHYIDAFPR